MQSEREGAARLQTNCNNSTWKEARKRTPCQCKSEHQCKWVVNACALRFYLSPN